jgi:hypothetical protein
MVCLSDNEYQALVRARGKHEYQTGQKASGFGELIMLLAGLYLADKFLKSPNGQERRESKRD